MTFVAYALTYVFAWAAALATDLLVHVRAALAFVAPADVAEFVSRPYVFSGLCLIAAAVIANGTKVFIWWKDNKLKRQLDDLLKERKQVENKG
jgi:hypothetical protein